MHKQFNQFVYSRSVVHRKETSSPVVHQPETSSRTVECEAKTDPICFESQTEISLPEYCKVVIRQNVLTTDINLFVDFTTHPFDWWYDGNIFKYVFSNVTELLESIQRIVWQCSNFGLSGLKHFKHSYEKVFYSVDAIWDKIMSLDFINWLDTLSIIVFACLALIFLCIVHTNGWHKKFYECF